MVAPSSTRIDVGGRYVRCAEVRGDANLLLVTADSGGALASLAKGRVVPLTASDDEGFNTDEDERAILAHERTSVAPLPVAAPVIGTKEDLSLDDPAPASADGSIVAAGSPALSLEWGRDLGGLDTESGHGAPSRPTPESREGATVATGSPQLLSASPENHEKWGTTPGDGASSTAYSLGVTPHSGGGSMRDVDLEGLRSTVLKAAALFALVGVLVHRR